MDSDHQNWLAFSLSNHALFQPTPITLLFNNNPCNGAVHAINNNPENGTSTDHLSVFAGGGGGGCPKLEDYLSGSGSGGSGGSGGGTEVNTNGVVQFDGGVGLNMYDDSEFKKLAASFLAGFSPPETTHKQVVVPAPPPPPEKKTAETIGHRTSVFRGVTRHRWTGRYEAHLWDNSCRREGQSRKGRQVYLGGYDKEEKAARAYDLAALKYWGPTTTTNFPVSNYEKELEEMQNMTRQEFVASLRRKSSGFSRGASIYRGVTRHHQHGRWQARIGRVAGNKDLYLGTFSTQEEAAEAYDIAAIKFRGVNAVTNFDMTRYDVKSIASSNLPVGGVCNNNKLKSTSSESSKAIEVGNEHTTFQQPQMGFTMPVKQDNSSSLWAALGYQNGALTNNVPFNMEFELNNSNKINNEEFFNVGGFYQQQLQLGNCTSSDSDTVVVGNNGATTTSDDGSLDLNGNWTPPKANMLAYRTPIYGME